MSDVDGILGGHSPGSQSKTSRDDGGKTLGNGGDGESHGDLEIVDGSLDPGSSVSGVVEMSNINGPDGDADEGDDLGQLLTEFVELLLERSLDFFGLSHFISDLANGGVDTSSDDDTTSLAGGNIGAGEDNVLLVLVDGSWIRNRITVFDDGDRFSGQNRLVNTEGGGVNLTKTKISRNLVTNRDLNDVSGNNIHSLHLLNTISVGSDNFACLRLILFQCLNS